jgi:hypothetical protein
MEVINKVISNNHYVEMSMTLLQHQELGKEATLATNRMINVLQNGRSRNEETRLLA